MITISTSNNQTDSSVIQNANDGVMRVVSHVTSMNVSHYKKDKISQRDSRSRGLIDMNIVNVG